MRQCKGICKGTRRLICPYAKGFIYCCECAVYFKSNASRCNCCKSPLRHTSTLLTREVKRY